ncbi:MAG TPA: cytochrome D1 domain-containing protein [Bryobacteraceae bacterium]|nr:cytochrome D1 domain-containing protein [Bryobacteraceae bacterium]
MKCTHWMFGAIAFALFSLTAGGAPPDTQGYLLVANKGDRTLGIIDPAAGKEVAAVPENGVTGHEVIASPHGGTAYVPIYGNSGVGKPGTDGTNMVAIDLASRKIVGNLDFGHGVRPHCAQFGPKDGMLYVSTELDHTISIIDPKTLKIVGSLPTGQAESHMFVISHDGQRAYTANVGPGTVSVIDLKTRKTLHVIPISPETQRISISMDDKRVFTSDQTKPRLAVIDTRTDKVADWVELPGLGYGTAPTPDGHWLVVAVPTVNKVAVIDLRTLRVAHTIDVPKAPQEVLIRPDGKMAYVSCDSAGKIAAIRTSDWKIDTLISAGKGADGLAWSASL